MPDWLKVVLVFAWPTLAAVASGVAPYATDGKNPPLIAWVYIIIFSLAAGTGALVALYAKSPNGR